MMLLHLSSLNHLSKFRRCDRFLKEYYSVSATTVSHFSAAHSKPYFPDPPSIITPKASPPRPRSSSEHRPVVFLSFRGEDTRRGFVKSLHEALCFAGIPAFKDDVDLTKGGRIQRGLMDAIHQSWVFVPVISSNYASSKWCLEELAEIMKCVRMESRTVFPVFYDVRPTDVRHLKPPFSAAFAQLEEDCRKVKVWKRALSEVAEFSGFDLIYTYQRILNSTLQATLEQEAQISSVLLYCTRLQPGLQLPTGYIYTSILFFTTGLAAIAQPLPRRHPALHRLQAITIYLSSLC